MRSRRDVFQLSTATDATALTRLRIPTAAGTFDAVAAGPLDGRKVLLLHGVPECGIEWRHQLRALAADGYRAVAPNQRGYSPGVRPKRVDDYRVENAVDDVAAIADQLGWRRFDLVGHDWGAVVGWEAAARLPLRVRTLTAVSAPHPGAFAEALRNDPDQQRRAALLDYLRQPEVPEREMLANGAARLRQGWPAVIPRQRVEQYVRQLSEPGALTAALNWYRANTFTGDYQPVSVPTMYLWGSEDDAVGPEAAQATSEWVTGAYRFEVLDQVGHFVPEEAAERTTSLLLEHLGKF
ncbi:alpha/beta fold hydrolase [Umezawaea tangerina]|uniref:Pimeloyl-ACP methyl ester carboxylesterase n=1 Tax=Umezawaea tangerina TaxID=84725 RepID=A0A2T0SC77_9PSEU|nr:alpha/beta hydrolase [Umezawaea tangerina]PRY30981.1 pimeloyl-ACP methyl ester carboxylesterase [Umezawaea tangerina]